MTANEMYHAAQALIRQGQPVFPCLSKGKKAKTPITENGFLDATLDKMLVKRWLTRRPDASIAIPTGIIWDVLDVDMKRGVDGRKHMTQLNELGLLNGCKSVVKTPSGGWHLYFLARPGLRGTTRADLGLDLRAQGNYVLAAPSYIETPEYSGRYQDMGPTVGSSNDPLWWELIVSTLAPTNRETKKPIELLPSERRASVAHLREWLSMRIEGERNTALHWAVCRCIENGIDPNELMEAAIYIGLEEDEISKTINSALRRAGVIAEQLDSEAEALFPEQA